MDAIPRKIKKALREYAGIAYEAELRIELQALSAKFADWKSNQIDSFDLTEAIHQFHNGPARDLYKKYNNAPLDLVMAHAIATGLLNKDEIPAEMLEHLSAAIALYEEHQRQDRRDD
ncbi:MAG TPA: hypothetical protein VJ754_06655 [Anaerolineae bacterium]|nr:hypothetical protein [Anaerolineae bacterium]